MRTLIRVIILIVLLNCSFAVGYAQNKTLPSIISDSTYKKGIYIDLIDFRDNAPKDIGPFTVLEKKRALTLFSSHIQYEIILEKESDGAKIDLNTVWGFCDGENVYISGDRGLSKRNCFEKFYVLGMYSCFIKWGYMDEYNIAMNGLQNSSKNIVMDLNTVNTFLITKKYLLEILSNYPDLLTKFKSEKKKSKKFIDYIKKVNEKYTSK